MRMSTGNFDSVSFSRSYTLFELRNLAKMKDITQNSLSYYSKQFVSVTPLKTLNNFLKLCCNEGHNV